MYTKNHLAELDEIAMRTSPNLNAGQKWEKPYGDMVKINFDCAYDGGSHKSTLGIVAKNVKGVVLCSRSELHDDVLSAFAAEAIACRKAVEMGLELGWADIIVEGDLLTTMKKCIAKTQDKSVIGAYIRNIKQISGRMMAVRFRCVPRLANGLANIIAKETLKWSSSIYLVGGIPVYTKRAMAVNGELELD